MCECSCVWLMVCLCACLGGSEEPAVCLLVPGSREPLVPVCFTKAMMIPAASLRAWRAELLFSRNAFVAGLLEAEEGSQGLSAAPEHLLVP